MPVTLAMIQDALVLQIPVSLSPPIFIDHIDERNMTDRPKPSHRVADRQQGIGVDTGRQAEHGFSFLLNANTACQSRAEVRALAASSIFCTAG
jgi:hypothetical protein